MTLSHLFAEMIDPRSLGKVAVLMGGTSAEREVSLRSGAGVLAALRSCGVDAHAFDPAQQDIFALKVEGVSRCFIALHGRHGEDGTVQGALELMRIPYTGAGVMASSIAMDKVMTKRIWQAEGLPTPDWRLCSSEAQVRAAFAQLGSPMIVKPAREGSSLGLSRVVQTHECDAAYARAAQHDADVLCEQFIDGQETTVAVLGTGARAQALPLIRIEAPGGNYDYHHKYQGNATRYHCPSGLPADEESAIAQHVLRAYRVLGCRGWGRVDVMVRASDRRPFLLEINTAPGMTDHSLVPMAARATGLEYAPLCLRILAEATLDGAVGAVTAAPVVADTGGRV